MKTIYLTTIAMLTAFAFPALAEKPNRVTMSWPEFVAASGCEIRPNSAGQLNLYAKSGGNCPASVVTAFWGTGTLQGTNPGPDGTLGTPDDYSVALSDN